MLWRNFSLDSLCKSKPFTIHRWFLIYKTDLVTGFTRRDLFRDLVSLPVGEETKIIVTTIEFHPLNFNGPIGKNICHFTDEFIAIITID